MYTYNLTRLQRRLKPILNCLLKAKPMRQFQTVTNEFDTNKKQAKKQGKVMWKNNTPRSRVEVFIFSTTIGGLWD